MIISFGFKKNLVYDCIYFNFCGNKYVCMYVYMYVYSQSLPLLKIPDNEQLILQTDASDHYWGALLIEESDRNIRVCGYKSGQFNDAQSNYPSSKKEVLAVIKGIKKF